MTGFMAFHLDFVFRCVEEAVLTKYEMVAICTYKAGS
jgi:hypothetical protein